jgi:hypothetical protein
MGTFAAGCGSVFVASAGPNGTLAGGDSTTSVVLSTALPAAVGINQLANRGGLGTGFKIRITGNSAGGSGKTEEAYIIGNTAGTTPTITLATALSFTPQAGDRYEFLSGRVFIFATGATVFKYYDIATNSMSGSLNVTNLTTPATDISLLALDELYTPIGQLPGMGFFGNLTATATSSTTLTGTAAGTDASLQANEYANFQIRVVMDTATPTSVGQRRKITSHTAANPTVYTLSTAWTVTPSATATYVIEGIGDIICFTAASTTSFTYAAGGWRADGPWSTATTNGGSAALQIPSRPANTAAGISSCWPFGLAALDAAKNMRYSNVYLLRGGGVNTIDALDIAALSWSAGTGGSDIAYGNKGTVTFTTGTCGTYDPATNNGQYWYINQNGGQRFLRFDVLTRTLVPWSFYRQTQAGAIVGERMAVNWAVDGSAVGTYVYFWGGSQANFTRVLVAL